MNHPCDEFPFKFANKALEEHIILQFSKSSNSLFLVIIFLFLLYVCVYLLELSH